MTTNPLMQRALQAMAAPVARASFTTLIWSHERVLLAVVNQHTLMALLRRGSIEQVTAERRDRNILYPAEYRLTEAGRQQAESEVMA